MLVMQWICVWFTARDPGNQGRNKKLFSLVLWIIPVLSNGVSGTMYALALGIEFSPVAPTIAIMGAVFAIIGNYLPKTRMNGTMGIKIYWTYTSEDNWNATHRFGGKVWAIGGICLMFSALLPEKIGITVMLASILVLVIIPVVYSYLYYRKQVARGDALNLTNPASTTKAGKYSLIFILIILAAVSVLMFTGEINVHCEEDAMHIEASWYSDLTVSYDVIESVEYREGNVDGIRVGGFGSAKLLMGFFRNDEFGNYTRYTVTRPEACIVVHTQKSVLVISGDNVEETAFIYDSLMAKLS